MAMFRRSALHLVILLCVMSACAQKRSSAKVGVNNVGAPVPAPLLGGKRAFISYELGDVTAFPSGYSGGPERAYSEFYDDMKAWGHYELVSDPSQADVVFAIRFVEYPNGSVPQVRLGISDAKTHVSLWGFVEEIKGAFHKKNRDTGFSDAVQKLVSDVQELMEQNPQPVAQP